MEEETQGTTTQPIFLIDLVVLLLQTVQYFYRDLIFCVVKLIPSQLKQKRLAREIVPPFITSSPIRSVLNNAISFPDGWDQATVLMKAN